MLLLIACSSCLSSENENKTKPFKGNLSSANTDCSFSGLTEEWPVPHKSCGNITADGKILLKKYILEKIKFNEDGLAGGIFNLSDCYWLNKIGLLRRTACNGPFADGLVRHIGAKGRYGYLDKKLNIVIKPTYDFGFPFFYKYPRVCNGCKEHRSQDSEHSPMKGGQWYVINQSGKVVNFCKGNDNGSNCKIPSY